MVLIGWYTGILSLIGGWGLCCLPPQFSGDWNWNQFKLKTSSIFLRAQLPTTQVVGLHQNRNRPNTTTNHLTLVFFDWWNQISPSCEPIAKKCVLATTSDGFVTGFTIHVIKEWKLLPGIAHIIHEIPADPPPAAAPGAVGSSQGPTPGLLLSALLEDTDRSWSYRIHRGIVLVSISY